MLEFFTDFSIVSGPILKGFWLPFGFHLKPKIASRTHPGCSWGTGCLPKGAQEPSEPPKASKNRSSGIRKLSKWSPGDPQGSQNEPLGSDGAPQTAPGSHSDAGKRPEARRKPRGPQNNPQVTRKLPNRSFKSIRESGPILGLRIYPKSFKSL